MSLAAEMPISFIISGKYFRIYGRREMLKVSTSDIDERLNFTSDIQREGMEFYDVREEPFKVYGVEYSGDRFIRMPLSVAEEISEGVLIYAKQTSGGRVRFITDSPYVIIRTKAPGDYMPHMPASGSSGFDLYARENGRENFKKNFMPYWGKDGAFDGVADFYGDKKERQITINFPLYSSVTELYIGVKEGSVLRAPEEYSIAAPMVFYGSSITQGACASRPGTCYQALLSRRYDANYLSLGLNGSARGEERMAEYIANLEMSAFVYDYDFNTPSVEHLWKTHEPFFKKIRESHPDIPIVMMSRPDVHLNPERDTRHAAIKQTYENAVASGDRNVYLISGNELMEIAGDNGNVDCTHPTDLGFYSMAVRVSKELDKVFTPVSDFGFPKLS